MSNWIRQACILSLTGFILSGPVGFTLVKIWSPQPEWTNAGSFVEHYHILQDIPYFFGFLLLAGQLLLVLAHYEVYSHRKEFRFPLRIAVVLMIIFCTLISFNYIVQTTFVHNLAWNYQPAYERAIQDFSMANSLSLAWAIELWGYGLLGISLWLIRGIYVERFPMISNLLRVNLISSIVPILWTILDVNWVLTTLGLGLYLFWNLLMILILIIIWRADKKMNTI